MSGGLFARVGDLFADEPEHDLPTIDGDLPELLDSLQNLRRREVIRIAAAEGNAGVTIGSLAEQIAATEYDLDAIEEVSSDQRQRVYIALYQHHLPTLNSAGLVNVDERVNTVTATDHTKDIAEVLRILEVMTGGGA